MTIGKRINKRRVELGLSVDSLSEKLGKNRATIYRYESNYIENLPLSVLEPLAKALQTTPAYLAGWEDLSTVAMDRGANSSFVMNEALPWRDKNFYDRESYELVKKYKSLTPEAKRKASNYFDHLIALGKHEFTELEIYHQTKFKSQCQLESTATKDDSINLSKLLSLFDESEDDSDDR